MHRLYPCCLAEDAIKTSLILANVNERLELLGFGTEAGVSVLGNRTVVCTQKTASLKGQFGQMIRRCGTLSPFFGSLFSTMHAPSPLGTISMTYTFHFDWSNLHFEKFTFLFRHLEGKLAADAKLTHKEIFLSGKDGEREGGKAMDFTSLTLQSNTPMRKKEDGGGGSGPFSIHAFSLRSKQVLLLVLAFPRRLREWE